MEVLVGVDLTGSQRPAMELLVALRFPNPSVRLVNVVEPVLPGGTYPEMAAAQPSMQIIEDLTRAGHEALHQAEAWFAPHGLQAHGDVLLGSAPGVLMESCDKWAVDLVALGAVPKSPLESVFTGSVAKSLTTGCRSSLLVGKSSPATMDSLTTVFAHDLSDYCQTALERWVAMQPRGVSRVVLLTADTTDPSVVAKAEEMRPDMAGETEFRIHQAIEARQAGAAACLASLGCEVERRIEEGTAEEAVRRVMAETRADLLVLGAQGHSFLDRLFLGSFAMHQVAREPHNLLIVRPN